MDNKIKNLLYAFKLSKASFLADPIQGENKTARKDNEVLQAEKNFAISDFQMCSMQPHEASCPMIGCTKNPCFKWKPDKIVSKPYEVKAVKAKELKNRGS